MALDRDCAAGFAVYLFMNWKVTGDPFSFLRMRKQLFTMEGSWPWVGIRNAIGNLRGTRIMLRQ
jgi:hypothetical protein